MKHVFDTQYLLNKINALVSIANYTIVPPSGQTRWTRTIWSSKACQFFRQELYPVPEYKGWTARFGGGGGGGDGHKHWPCIFFSDEFAVLDFFGYLTFTGFFFEHNFRTIGNTEYNGSKYAHFSFLVFHKLLSICNYNCFKIVFEPFIVEFRDVPGGRGGGGARASAESASLLGGSGCMLPRKILKISLSENAFPGF